MGKIAASVLFVFIFSFVSLSFGGPIGPAWNITTVDSEGDVGRYNSISADENGRVSISYYDFKNGTLKYATGSSGYFEASVLDGAIEVGKYGSLARDGKGAIHVAYQSGDETRPCDIDLKYITNALKQTTDSKGGFKGEIIDDAVPNDDFKSGGYASIAVDEKGAAHIAYYDFTNRDLKYASGSIGSWRMETVDASGDVGLDASIAVKDGVVHLSYYDYTAGALKHAFRTAMPPEGGETAAPWTIETVDKSSADVGQYTSIALDSKGKAHISYYDSKNKDLRYATNSKGRWLALTIDKKGDVGRHTSIAVDSKGRIHISYYSAKNGDLKYAANASGMWNVLTVDRKGDVGEYSSIDVDSKDRVHISYYDFTNGDLRYAVTEARSK